MSDQAPQTAVCWNEIPVSDMDKAVKFYDEVFKWRLTIDNSGPNPMAWLGGDMDTAGGHLYPGTPATDGNGPTVHIVVPDTVEEAAARCRAAVRSHRDPPWPLCLCHRPGWELLGSVRTGQGGLMRRADRLFRLVQLLRGGRLTTAQALADTLEVSPRTIYRDVADLIGSGVPIEGEAGVGYIMREGFDLPPLMFTRAEITALVAGARMVRSWGGASMALAADEALSKIRAVLPPDLAQGAERVEIHALGHWGLTDRERALIDRLEAATDASVMVRLDYQDAEGAATTRLVRPLGLLFWGKVWTLAAWCELRAGFRMFRIDRIQTMHEGPSFRPEPDKTLAAFYAAQKACDRQ